MSLAPATCPRCNGSGWVPVGGDSLRVEACGCQPDLRRRQRIDSAHIPKRYLHCKLENFHERSNGALIAGRRTVQEFVDRWPMTAHGKGLLIMGGCGVGKTHLAVAALMEIIQKTKSGRFLFTNFQELIQEIQASFDNDAVPSKSEILRPVIDADLLVLDELGSQKPTTFVQDILYYVINSRYNEERPTIFTTNYTEDLTDRISERLRSRLYEMTIEVKLSKVPDYRADKKNMI